MHHADACLIVALFAIIKHKFYTLIPQRLLNLSRKILAWTKRFIADHASHAFFFSSYSHLIIVHCAFALLYDCNSILHLSVSINLIGANEINSPRIEIETTWKSQTSTLSFIRIIFQLKERKCTICHWFAHRKIFYKP